MPRSRDFRLFDRPRSYGFESFDDLMQQLRAAISAPDVIAEALAALQLDSRQVDADQLAHDLHLDRQVVEIIEHLAAWGDRGEQIHAFASVRLATINAGSALGHCDLSTAVLAQRTERGFAVLFADENGGHGELGEFVQPLSFLELIVVVDAALLRQAPGDISDGAWQSGYFDGDPTMTVRVSSPHYSSLASWYEQAVAEWTAAQRSEDGWE
jgi:hypothetical protein